MGTMITAIIACCRQELWPFVALPDEPVVQLTVSTACGVLAIYCEAREQERELVVYARYGAKAPPARRTAVAELIARANWGLTIGNFELDFDGGEVRFRVAVDLDQETVTPGLVRPLIRHAVFRADQYLAPYHQVAFGHVAPADAIEAVERYALEDVMSDACRRLGA
jgi:hypothetical protein